MSGARGLSYAKRFNAEYCCSDYDEILNDKDVDVVFIVTRNQHHAAQAIAALRAGKHVFVEKPMALTLDECRDIEQAVYDSGKQLTVGFDRRFAVLRRAEESDRAPDDPGGHQLPRELTGHLRRLLDGGSVDRRRHFG